MKRFTILAIVLLGALFTFVSFLGNDSIPEDFVPVIEQPVAEEPVVKKPVVKKPVKEGKRFAPKTCDYCGGQITYQKIDDEGTYNIQWDSGEDTDNKPRHTWCARIVRLEARIKELENNDGY